MAQNLDLNVNVNTDQAGKSVGSLKTQLREAQAEVVALSDKFGATSKEAIEAAKRAGELRDRIGDASALTQAFNPDAKFRALTASLSGVAGGFAAVQGAMALFGAESEDVQKTLLKVQAAMALSQGLQSVGESIDSFKQLGAVIKSTTVFQGAYNFVMGQSSEVIKVANVELSQNIVELNTQSTATAVVATTTSAATIALRVFRAALLATGIGAIVLLLTSLISSLGSFTSSTKKAKEEQDKLNESIKTSNEILDNNINKIQRAGNLRISELKKNNATEAEIYSEQRKIDLELLDEYLEDYRKKYAIFEKDQIKNGKSTDEKIKENSDNFRKEALQASYKYYNQEVKLQIDADNEVIRIKKLNDDKQKEIDQKKKETKANELQELKDSEKETMLVLLSEREAEEFKINEHYSRLLFLASKYNQDDSQIKEAHKVELNKISDKYLKKEQEDERLIAFQRIQNLITDIDYENSLLDFDFELDQQRLANKEAYIAEQKAIELSNLDLTGKERLEIIAKYAKQEQDIEKEVTASKKAEKEAQTAMQLQYIGFAEQAGNLLGQIAGKSKAIAIAGLLIEKGAAIAKIITQMGTVPPVVYIPAPPYVLPNPAFIPSRIGGALSIASVIAASVNGIQQINQAGSGGTGSSSVPSISTQAPMLPQLPAAQTTNISRQSINDMGNQAVRAYVIETDVTGNQQRMAAIRQRARFS